MLATAFLRSHVGHCAIELLEERRLFTALFAPVQKIAAGTGAQGITYADFNGDKLPDVAVANNTSGTVSIFLNKGGGKFTALPAFAAGANLSGIVAADFNGDGKPDLAVVGDDLAICLGLGAGKFAAPVHIAAGNVPQLIATADFNTDGKPDLAITDILGDTVTVLLGKGLGKFNTPTTITGIPGAAGIAVGDFNGDKKPDLAVTSMGHVTFDFLGNPTFGVSSGVQLLLGTGTGTFTRGKAFAVGKRPISVAAGDVNGDGKLDLVACNGGLNSADGQNTVSVLLNTGAGSFAAAKSYATAAVPEGVVLSDVDSNGKLDILTANYGGNNISVLTNKGTGTFNTAINFASGKGNGQLIAVDINGDKQPDVLSAAFNDNSLDVLVHAATVLPPHATVAGKTLQQWSAAWWQYVFSVPSATNPLFDATGVNAKINQSGPVFFLAGTLSVGGVSAGPSTYSRTITVTSGQYLFVPISTAWFDNLGSSSPETVAQLQADAAKAILATSAMHLTVDGIAVTDLTTHREISPVFSYSIPNQNVFYRFGYKFPAQTVTPAVADGYWAMIAPLSPGQHVINFGASAGTSKLDITYHINVTAAP